MRNRVGRLLIGAALVALIPFGRTAFAADLNSLKNLPMSGLADLPVVVVPASDEKPAQPQTTQQQAPQDATTEKPSAPDVTTTKQPAQDTTTQEQPSQDATTQAQPAQKEPAQTETPGQEKVEQVPPKEDTTEESTEEEAPKAEFHGNITAGWNFFIKRPSNGYGFNGAGVPLTASQTKSIAGFERFGEIPKGPFVSGVNLDYLSADGLFGAKFHAKDIGQNDQSYQLRLGQAGVYDLIFGYNQIPHLASTSGKTLFDTSNPASLTVPDAVQSALQADTAPWTASNNTINSNVRRIELKTERDIARVVYGYKPDPAWDFRVGYTHEDKHGTQALGTVMNNAFFGGGAIEVPAPVNYTTQTIDASAQYMGKYGDNKRYNISFAYAGSIFDDHNRSVAYENPFRLTPPNPVPAGDNTANLGRSGLPPDNYANRYSLTGGIDLPFDSRYMGTVTFNQMRQNQKFIPETINPTIATTPLPATSLHGKVDTLLINNVVNTNFTDNLSSTLRYRYYDVNNNTPELLFNSYVVGDGALTTEDIRSLSMGYTRQNASADLTWRALDWLTLGAGYAWENYDRTRRDVDVTNEHSGKLSLDANPFDWMHLRASYLLAYRRYNNYDALAYVGIPAYPGPPPGAGFTQSSLMRKLDMANRDRQKVQASLELTTPIDGLVVTPSGSWERNEYSDGSTSGGSLGLKQDTTWTAGLEVAYAPMTELSLMAGYLHEDMNRALVNSDVFTCGGVAPTPACDWGSRLHDIVDTIYAGANYQIIPDSLTLRVSYSFSQAIGQTATYPLGSAGITSSPQYPDVKNTTHALSVRLRYKMDEDTVHKLGWVGDVTTTLGYTFAYNKMNNWQINDITPYMVNTDAGANKSLFLGFLNPNYISHYVGLTTEIHW